MVRKDTGGQGGKTLPIGMPQLWNTVNATSCSVSVRRLRATEAASFQDTNELSFISGITLRIYEAEREEEE